MSVNVEVNINPTQKIIKDHGLDEDGVITKVARDEVYKLYEPYTPRDTGNLYKEVTFPNNHSIKHTSPYAHYMYKGELMLAPNGSAYAKEGEEKHYAGKSLKYQGAPKRGANWDKRMMNDRGSEVCAFIQSKIKNGG